MKATLPNPDSTHGPHSSAPISILVVDDHGIVRDGIAALLGQQQPLRVVGFAATGKQAVIAARRLKPTVVVMDLVLPELSGIDATERILSELPQTRIVILTACHSSEHIFRALRVGAGAYVLKESAATELLHAISAVLVGERYLSSQIKAVLVDGLLSNTASHSPLERLSPREREVLHLTVAGQTSAEMALKLSLSRKTVDTYRSRVMEKLGVDDLAGLIHFAVEHAMTPI